MSNHSPSPARGRRSLLNSLSRKAEKRYIKNRGLWDPSKTDAQNRAFYHHYDGSITETIKRMARAAKAGISNLFKTKKKATDAAKAKRRRRAKLARKTRRLSR